jgi:riboflavin biosynthesis pyrimidine reductase
LTRRLQTPASATLLNDGHATLIVSSAGDDVDAEAVEQFQRAHSSGPASLVQIEECRRRPVGTDDGADAGGGLSLHDILAVLQAQHGVRHLMVEGGPETARRFLRSGLVDRAIIVTAPVTFEIPVPSGICEVRVSSIEGV